MAKIDSKAVEKILVEMLVGKEPSIKGAEADKVRASLQKDIDLAKKNGWAIEIPFEIPDL